MLQLCQHNPIIPQIMPPRPSGVVYNNYSNVLTVPVSTLAVFSSDNRPSGPLLPSSCQSDLADLGELGVAGNWSLSLGGRCGDVWPTAEKYRRRGLLNIYLTKVTTLPSTLMNEELEISVTTSKRSAFFLNSLKE